MPPRQVASNLPVTDKRSPASLIGGRIQSLLTLDSIIRLNVLPDCYVKPFGIGFGKNVIT